MVYHHPGTPLSEYHSVDDIVTMVIQVYTMDYPHPGTNLVRVSVDDIVTMVIQVYTMDYHHPGTALIRDDVVTMVVQVYTMDYPHPGTPLTEYPWMT